MPDFFTSIFSLAGKTALITGGTRGIGASMTLALATAGADIVLVQRNEKDLTTHNAIKALGRRVSIVACDLSDNEQVRTLAKRVIGAKEEGGLGEKIDILLNCGGIVRRSPAEDASEEDWDEVIQTNLKSTWLITRDIGKHMLQSRGADPSKWTSQSRGKIINMASVVSFQGGYTVAAYAASKHGVSGITKAFSNEWAGKGINVNSLAPGYIDTSMNDALINDPVRSQQIMARIPAGRWGDVKDFDGLIVMLASKASDYICGENLMVDGGFLQR